MSFAVESRGFGLVLTHEINKKKSPKKSQKKSTFQKYFWKDFLTDAQIFFKKSSKKVPIVDPVCPTLGPLEKTRFGAILASSSKLLEKWDFWKVDFSWDFFGDFFLLISCVRRFVVSSQEFHSPLLHIPTPKNRYPRYRNIKIGIWDTDSCSPHSCAPSAPLSTASILEVPN